MNKVHQNEQYFACFSTAYTWVYVEYVHICMVCKLEVRKIKNIVINMEHGFSHLITSTNHWKLKAESRLPLTTIG